ncbi:MAG: hypothetical protein JXP34_19335 [Planctomycetes bacterium]|nr:hypothetical protein [Planctomycetota bacterium]
MDRNAAHPLRDLGLSSLALMSLACWVAPGRILAAAADERIVLGDDRVSLEVGSERGTIVRIRDAGSGMALAPPPGMAENFRMLLRKPDGAAATIFGRDQALTASRLDGRTLSLSWEGPLRDTTGAEYDLRIRMEIEAGAGFLTFTLHADNRTSGKLEDVSYPMVGGLAALAARGGTGDASLWIPTSNPSERAIALPFAEAAFGYPGQMNMSFSCIRSRSAGRSLYFASHDPIARYKVYRFLPASGSAGEDILACIRHTPFLPPGKTFDGSPVVLGFVDGDWPSAGEVYREWFGRTFGIAQPSQDWIRRQSFFLMTMFMLPEGTINYTFKDIPAWAKSAKDYGIEAVQISGWNVGGHDNGYPRYSIDPRLGTWEDLEDGIRACHEMGLKVYFFVNYEPVMIDTQWYKRELSRYREMAADGGYTWNTGWGMGTLWARMGHPKLMTWADPSFPEFRRIIVDAFARLARIGADGVHVDKLYPSAIEFNPDVPSSPDTATWEGAIILTREVMRECRKYRPDWAMSFECAWDRVLEFGGATWWVGNQRITRRVFPENVETLGLYQAFDYLGVNDAVRDGHAVMVAPLNFCRALDWPPFLGLAGYIREVKRIRDDLQATVFFGEVLGPTQVTFEGPMPDGVRYNTFRNRKTGGRACILTNSRMEERAPILAAFEGSPGGAARIRTPFREVRIVKLPAPISIPAERITFVEELGGER